MDDFYYVSSVPAYNADKQLAEVEFNDVTDAVSVAKVLSYYNDKTTLVLHQLGADCILISVWFDGERIG